MENKVTKYFLQHGLIYATISVIVTVLLYLAGPQFFSNNMFIFGALLLLLAITYPIVIVYKFRKQNDNYITFREAFLITFCTLGIAGFVTLIFGIILYNLIDPDYPKVLTEKITEKTVTMMQNFGAPQDKIDEQVAKMSQDNKFSVPGQLKSFLFSIVFYALFGLIIAAIFKKTKNELFDSQT
jgi:hypothetical protein